MRKPLSLPTSPTETLIIAGVLVLALGSWLELRAVASERSSHDSLVRQIGQMSRDAERVKVLRVVPRAATDRERPNDELLAEIRDAMERAGVPVDRWIGNDPSPPVRLPRSPYKRLTTRISFEQVTLQELVSLAYYLVQIDAALTVSEIRLVAPRSDAKVAWNADLTLSYLIYSPHEHSPG